MEYRGDNLTQKIYFIQDEIVVHCIHQYGCALQWQSQTTVLNDFLNAEMDLKLITLTVWARDTRLQHYFQPSKPCQHHYVGATTVIKVKNDSNFANRWQLSINSVQVFINDKTAQTISVLIGVQSRQLFYVISIFYHSWRF